MSLTSPPVPEVAEEQVSNRPAVSRGGQGTAPLLAARLVRAIYILLLLGVDVFAVGLAFFTAYSVSAAMEERPNRVPPFADYLPTLGLLIPSLLITFAFMRLYLPRRGNSHADQLGSLFVAIAVGNVIAMAGSNFTATGQDARHILVYTLPLSILLVWLLRSLAQETLRMARRAGLDAERVLIVGAGEFGARVLHKIAAAPDLGYRVVGFVDDWVPGAGDRRTPAEAPILGPVSGLANLIPEHGIHSVIVADPSLSHVQLLEILSACDKSHVNLKIFPDLFQLVVQEVTASELGGLPLLRVRDVSLRGWNLLVKRGLDVVLASVLLVLLSPLMLVVAVAVKLTSRGPVFFIQERVGVDGRPFPCVKYRTMRVDAEAQSGPVWALPGDPRTTPPGRLLRRFSVDELPQLVNVLVGDMSLVGPRPERPYFVEQFSRLIPRYEQRHQEKAGVTGWAQVNGLRGQTPIEERTLYDLFYVEHWSPGFDLKILIKTAGAVIRGRNAY